MALDKVSAGPAPHRMRRASPPVSTRLSGQARRGEDGAAADAGLDAGPVDRGHGSSFSHAGGVMPFVSEHLVRVAAVYPALAAKVPNGVLSELKRFHCDTALRAHPTMLASIVQLLRVSQPLSGTDAPLRISQAQVQGKATASARASFVRSTARTPDAARSRRRSRSSSRTAPMTRSSRNGGSAPTAPR